jgi:outer membrane protein OmpA-like peptidoglycan-associated protein
MDRRIIVFFMAIVLLPTFGLSQGGNLRIEGDRFYESKDYKNALAYYFRALRENPDDPELHFKIGRTYLNTETKELAISFLDKAYKKSPTIHPEILLYLGMGYQSSHQYAKAKYVYEHYLKVAPKKIKPEIEQKITECIVSHNLLSNPLDVIIENAGTNINSVFNDYAPVVSSDGKMMIFTSNRSADSIQVKLKKNFEDIYVARKDDNGDWTVPKKIGAKLNISTHDAVASISPDEKTLFIYYGTNNGDLYTSTVDDNGEWSKPVPLNKNINTPYFRETSASISADGKKLYFSSDRAGGKGGLDVYVSEMTEIGWGKAVNMMEINTAGNEDSPYIHPDGETLYFSSDGLPGMGSSDIFRTSLKNGKWQKPENLGYPINSIQYDGFFNISRDKNVAYFTTRRKYGVGEYDIVKATYRSYYESKPAEPVAVPVAPVVIAKKEETKKATPVTLANTVTLKGKAFEKGGPGALPVTISVVEFITQRQIASIKATGDYEFTLDKGGKYIITAESPGYLFNSVNVTIPETGPQKVNTDFAMLKVNVGSIMVLRNVFFDTGKSDLKPASISELEKIRKLLLANPNMKVQINGHTDNVGDPEFNKALSLKRALAVVNHLALNGIEFDRLGAKGFGAERPVASNDDEIGGRALNRRTEIEFVKDDKLASNIR